MTYLECLCLQFNRPEYIIFTSVYIMFMCFRIRTLYNVHYCKIVQKVNHYHIISKSYLIMVKPANEAGLSRVTKVSSKHYTNITWC